MSAELERARRAEPAWDEVRERRVLARVLAEKGAAARRRARARTVVIGGGAIAIAAAALLAWIGPREGAPGVADRAPEDARSTESGRLALADGSEVELGADARVEVEVQRAEEIRIAQRAGEARYVVSHRAERAFVVVTGDVEVVVRGTRFVVRVSPPWAEVEVEEGRVEVRRGGESRALAMGESLRVPMETASVTETASGVVAIAEREAAAGGGAETGTAAASAVEPEGESARPGATDRARPAPHAPRPDREPAPIDRERADVAIETLLGQADEARRAGRLDDAARALGEAIAQHREDPRVATALFTLGRVERSRGRDAAAAEAFEGAYERDPGAILAEDALAEAAVSWAAAGRDFRARAAARRYLEQYPSGEYVDRVRHLAE